MLVMFRQGCRSIDKHLCHCSSMSVIEIFCYGSVRKSWRSNHIYVLMVREISKEMKRSIKLHMLINTHPSQLNVNKTSTHQTWLDLLLSAETMALSNQKIPLSLSLSLAWLDMQGASSSCCCGSCYFLWPGGMASRVFWTRMAWHGMGENSCWCGKIGNGIHADGAWMPHMVLGRLHGRGGRRFVSHQRPSGISPMNYYYY